MDLVASGLVPLEPRFLTRLRFITLFAAHRRARPAGAVFRIRIASKTALRRDEPAGGDAQADDADTGCQTPFRRDKLGGDEREPITTGGVNGYIAYCVNPAGVIENLE